MKKLCLLLTLGILIHFQAYSISEAIDNTSLYNKALGGPHSGMAKGFDTFYNNPALLSTYDSEFSFFNFDVNIKGDTINIVNLYLGDELSLDEPGTMIDTLEEKGLTSLLIGTDLSGPIFIGKIGNNWGWSLKNSTKVYVDLPGLTSEAEIVAREDLTFSAGIAIPFKMMFGDSFFIKVTPGVMSRITGRLELALDSDLLGFMGYASDFATILDDYPVNFSPMFAVDFGFLISFYDIVSLSGVIKDIYTPILKFPVSSLDDALSVFTESMDTTGNIVYREINFGISSDIPLGPLSIIISDLDVYLDYFDLLETDKNLWLHFGAGIDIELLNKFHLLGGINEGLLALGLNVDLGGFDVGFAMYGTEESTQPGVNSTFNFLISMGISF